MVYRLEIFNECMIMMGCYHLFCFTDFTILESAKYRMGTSYVMFVAAVFVVNVIIMVIKNINRYRRKKMMEEKQKYFRIHRDEIIKKEVNDMEREKTRKQNLMSLEVQYQKQEEKKLIKMMETAYLGAHRGKQWDAARLVLAKNAKMIVYVPERKP